MPCSFSMDSECFSSDRAPQCTFLNFFFFCLFYNHEKTLEDLTQGLEALLVLQYCGLQKQSKQKTVTH